MSDTSDNAPCVVRLWPSVGCEPGWKRMTGWYGNELHNMFWWSVVPALHYTETQALRKNLTHHHTWITLDIKFYRCDVPYIWIWFLITDYCIQVMCKEYIVWISVQLLHHVHVFSAGLHISTHILAWFHGGRRLRPGYNMCRASPIVSLRPASNSWWIVL